MRATRWSIPMAAVTLLAGCSSGSVELVAPEPPPATAAPAPVQPDPPEGPAADPAPVAAPPVTEAPVAPPGAPPADRPAPPAEDDDPVLEGAPRLSTIQAPIQAPTRATTPAGPARTGAVQAASTGSSAKPTPTGRIEIPAIGLNHVTYEGIELATINYGPSHWPGTALPGQRGNTVFPGHRTTYSRPFFDLDKLVPGNEVIFTTPAGRFTYRVTQTMIVGSRDVYVVNPTPNATFTILACHPKGSAKQRIVVKGSLVAAPPPPPPPPTTPTTKPRQKFLGIL